MIIYDAFPFFQSREYDPPYSTHIFKVGSRSQTIETVRLEDGVNTV